MNQKKVWVSPVVEELGVEQTLGAPIVARFERTVFGPNDLSQPGQGSIPN